MFEYVGLGCTGPSWRRERAKSGSEASRLIAIGCTRQGKSAGWIEKHKIPWSLCSLARGWGFTFGPGCCGVASEGRVGGAFVDADEGIVEGDALARVGNFRAASPAVRAVFDPDAPIVFDIFATIEM